MAKRAGSLPEGKDFNVASVHNQVRMTAERLESELGEERPMFVDGCQTDWDRLPDPGPPLTVGLDGCYVHSKEQTSRTDEWFEAIVGKSAKEGDGAKLFGFVSTYAQYTSW